MKNVLAIELVRIALSLLPLGTPGRLELAKGQLQLIEFARAKRAT